MKTEQAIDEVLLRAKGIKVEEPKREPPAPANPPSACPSTSLQG